MPAFSLATAMRQSPTPSVWSIPTLVSVATSASTTLVASKRPSIPTSTTATSTATSAKCWSAAAVTVSNQVACIRRWSVKRATSPTAAPKVSGSMGSASTEIRSVGATRWGLT